MSIWLVAAFPAPSVPLTVWQVFPMGKYKIRQVFESSYGTYSSGGWFQTDIQKKAAHAILNCRSGKLGCNVSRCSECGHMEFHNNSLIPLTSMQFLPYSMSRILSFTVTRNFSMACSTDAVPNPFWSYQLIKSISGQPDPCGLTGPDHLFRQGAETR